MDTQELSEDVTRRLCDVPVEDRFGALFRLMRNEHDPARCQELLEAATRPRSDHWVDGGE